MIGSDPCIQLVRERSSAIHRGYDERLFTTIFILDDYQKVKMGRYSLQTFHARQKYVLMAFQPELLKELGRIAANHTHESKARLLEDYEFNLRKILNDKPNRGSHVNVCQHIAGYFKNDWSSSEKEIFNKQLVLYKEGKVGLSVLKKRLAFWASRLDKKYLLQQTYLSSFLS
ncbi:Uncharacterized conserved protein YbgA, DUF1722 family [Halobacillus alkaliphilus]|uniref:Uncharacterized conserved protein YbgA, DUF1722 family n=1 Tax=Halobacillus alkaliphilus TaxID=396056 RepID=A0A1I2L710_9BACI|nr:YbgA family protein [Halobacillus alkaliphilus]SFF75114.1 Uncharacterized conserved protein YbgA, DUF1722 family [Halobacillus alkaliphilus]